MNVLWLTEVGRIIRSVLVAVLTTYSFLLKSKPCSAHFGWLKMEFLFLFPGFWVFSWKMFSIWSNKFILPDRPLFSLLQPFLPWGSEEYSCLLCVPAHFHCNWVISSVSAKPWLKTRRSERSEVWLSFLWLKGCGLNSVLPRRSLYVVLHRFQISAIFHSA